MKTTLVILLISLVGPLSCFAQVEPGVYIIESELNRSLVLTAKPHIAPDRRNVVIEPNRARRGGDVVQQDGSQQWRVTLDSRGYHFAAISTHGNRLDLYAGSAAQSDGPDAIVDHTAHNASGAQDWAIDRKGHDIFAIRCSGSFTRPSTIFGNPKIGSYLDVYAGNTAPGAHVGHAYWNGSRSQLWHFVRLY